MLIRKHQAKRTARSIRRGSSENVCAVFYFYTMGDNPIGVFDSGVGGLSLLRELQSLLPNENFIYISRVEKGVLISAFRSICRKK